MPKYISEPVRQRVIEIAERYGFAVQLKDNGQDLYTKVLKFHSSPLNQVVYIRKERGVKTGGIPSYFHIAVHPEFYDQSWISASNGIEPLINPRKGNSLHASSYYRGFPVYPENNEPCAKCIKALDYDALAVLFKRMPETTGKSELTVDSNPIAKHTEVSEQINVETDKDMELQLNKTIPLDSVPTKGLIIKSPFIDRILAGSKTWEMRSSATQVRGPIALIKKGSGQVVGVANLVDVKGPLTQQQKLNTIDKHQISIERLKSGETDKWNTAWVLENAQPLILPVNYHHPKGAVIWVNLCQHLQEKLSLAMQ